MRHADQIDDGLGAVRGAIMIGSVVLIVAIALGGSK